MTDILEIAKSLVSGDRRQRYGTPLDNFTATAKIFSGILSHKLKEDITPEEALLLMQGIKIAREARSLTQDPSYRDNRIDGAGYWQALDDCVEDRKRR